MKKLPELPPLDPKLKGTYHGDMHGLVMYGYTEQGVGFTQRFDANTGSYERWLDMKLWLLTGRGHGGYDTYSEAVVVAATEEDARKIYPRPEHQTWGCYCKEEVVMHDWWDVGEGDCICNPGRNEWCTPEQVDVEEIGSSPELEAGTVVCASYHAG